MVTADIAFEAGRFLEAAKSFESLANRVDALPKPDAASAVLMRYIDVARQDRQRREGRRGVTEKLLALAPGRSATVSRARREGAARRGRATRGRAPVQELLERFDDKLGTDERADAMLGYGLGAAGSASPTRRWARCSEAADLDPESEDALLALLQGLRGRRKTGKRSSA
jgi:hypothetical protein